MNLSDAMENSIKQMDLKGLDRYRAHDVEILLHQWAHVQKKEIIKRDLSEALRIGKGRILLTSTKGEKQFWYSTSRVDSLTGGIPRTRTQFAILELRKRVVSILSWIWKDL